MAMGGMCVHEMMFHGKETTFWKTDYGNELDVSKRVYASSFTLFGQPRITNITLYWLYNVI